MINFINKAQNGNKDAMLHLINQFDPLIKKYSKYLDNEDTYQDLVIFFITLIHDWKISDLKNTRDGTLVLYIQKSLHNQYIYLLKRKIKYKNEIPISLLSNDQKDKLESAANIIENDSIFSELNLSKLLSEDEIKILYLLYKKGYSVNDIAKINGISRQAINQKKKKILMKLKEFLNS